MVSRAGFALLLVAGFLLEAAVTVSRHQGWAAGLVTVAATGGVCAAALLRRRRPGLAAIAAIALCALAEAISGRYGQPAPIACLALLVTVGAAVRRLPLPAVVATGLGSLAVSFGTAARYADVSASNARTATYLMIVGWAVAVGAGVWLRIADRRRRAVREAARRDERLALARDLHDVAAHHLTTLIIQAQVAQLAPGDERAALAGIEASGSHALASLRRVVRLLRDGDEPVGAETLGELVERFAGVVRVRLSEPDGPPPAHWPVELTTGLYRIAQEALTNVARHARDARCVEVTFAHDARVIRLTVTDDGLSADPGGSPGEPVGGSGWRRAAGGGHGVIGMRERAAALGGTLSAGPVVASGREAAVGFGHEAGVGVGREAAVASGGEAGVGAGRETGVASGRGPGVGGEPEEDSRGGGARPRTGWRVEAIIPTPRLT